MNRKKNGFTLIELLAVIVILAIIALIAVPVIMNIINKANKSAFKDTAYGIISAGELYFAERQLEPMGMLEDVEITLPDTTKKLELKGEVPEGEILITKEGNIALAVKNNRYCITKGLDDKDITVTEDVVNCKLQDGENNGGNNSGELDENQGEPIAYSYNGVELPTLPNWDNAAYPYAAISTTDGASNHLKILGDDAQYLTDSDGDFIFSSEIGLYSSCGLATRMKWTKPAIQPSGYSISVNAYIVWTSFDLLNKDGTVFMFASEPVPIYE